MRSFHLVLVFIFAGLACKEEPARRNNHGSASGKTERRYCGDRPISASGKILPINHLMQICSEHCWATVLEMLGSYYGKEVRVCELAERVKGESAACCALSDMCANSVCNQPVPERQIIRLLRKELGLRSLFSFRILEEEELQAELSNGRPIIVGYAGGDRSHVALVVGFAFEPDIVSDTKAVYYVVDPYAGFMQVDYLGLAEGPGITEPMPWVESWWRLSLREDGCNERFDPSCGCEASL